MNESLVLEELKKTIPKDKKRSVCKNCHELGHGIKSINCKINIDIHNKLKDKIKHFIMNDTNELEEQLNELCVTLNISLNTCKKLYYEIPLDELIHKSFPIECYLDSIQIIKCNDCHKNMYDIRANTNHVWKGSIVCDTCWCTYKQERDALWLKIKSYKDITCQICAKPQTSEERYHYDHINMFTKSNSICTMVNEGMPIDEIYNEIDKCQILCLSCHHIVTNIENKLGFTRIKQLLTRKINQISEEEYEAQRNYYQNIYEEKMKSMYQNVSTFTKCKV